MARRKYLTEETNTKIQTAAHLILKEEKKAKEGHSETAGKAARNVTLTAKTVGRDVALTVKAVNADHSTATAVKMSAQLLEEMIAAKKVA